MMTEGFGGGHVWEHFQIRARCGFLLGLASFSWKRISFKKTLVNGTSLHPPQRQHHDSILKIISIDKSISAFWSAWAVFWLGLCLEQIARRRWKEPFARIRSRSVATRSYSRSILSIHQHHLSNHHHHHWHWIIFSAHQYYSNQLIVAACCSSQTNKAFSINTQSEKLLIYKM